MNKSIETGYLENLTSSEKKVLSVIRSYVGEELENRDDKWNDWYLLRFCRARKFNVEKIKLMIKNYFEFQKEVDMDGIAKMDLSRYDLLRANTHHGYFFTDKKGQPVYYDFMRDIDEKMLFKNYTEKELIKYFVQSYERLVNVILPECSRVSGRKIEKTICIFDLKKTKILKMFRGQFKAFLKVCTNISQNYYPELLDKTFIINAGVVFSGIWSIAKYWIDEKTRKKIHIISGSGRKELQKYIDVKNIHVIIKEGQKEGNIRADEGPWRKALELSKKNKSLKHSDPALVKNFYLNI